jgi:bifunctional UDP-N-acetylglucosamine pyrophosphorylase/glucosamine-1-phosphate N-acetyltransferase
MSKDRSPRPFTAIILAAGEGTRMKSKLPKVLHRIAGLSMIGHVTLMARQAGAEEIIVVRSASGQEVEDAVLAIDSDVKFAVQDPPQGTGHAVQCAVPELASETRDVLVLYADTPLLREDNIFGLQKALEDGASVAVLGFHPKDPAAYGRLVVGPGDVLEAIVEYNDAGDRERSIDFCNSGVMAIKGPALRPLLDKLTNRNAKSEYYLTDLVAHAHEAGDSCKAVEARENDVLGVNARDELASAEAIFQRRKRRDVMQAGTTLLDPSTTYFSWDTSLAEDVTVEPNVFFGTGVTVERGATIHAFSHLEGAQVGERVHIGPFARLRPEAKIGKDAKIGNFVEVKKASVEAGVKISHLSYIGDARIGEASNIGAGTITVNYDGYNKHTTDIGKGVFIGSNSALVAPVKIGDNANVAAGSTITEDVSKNAMAIARGRQVSKEGRAKTYRAEKAKEKAEKK